MKSLFKFSFILSLLLSSIILNGQNFVTEHIIHDTSFVVNEEYKVADLAWIEGYWKGTGLGGYCEEIWSAPLNGFMTGIFRFFHDDKLVFSEILSLQDTEKGIGLLVKHFSPDFHAWEEKDDFINFRLIKIDGMQAFFQGLTIDGREAGKLLIYVLMKNKDGERWEEAFKFEKS